MTEQTESSAIVGVVVLVALLGSLLFVSDRLETARPFVEPWDPGVSTALERVPARLWQDPFDAVRRFDRKEEALGQKPVEALRKLQFEGSTAGDAAGEELAARAGTGSRSPPDDLAFLRRQIADRLKAQSSSRSSGGGDATSPGDAGNPSGLTVLGVNLFGGAVAADREHRLRARYAILSALAQMQLTPEAGDRIGYVRWTQGGGALQAGASSTEAPSFSGSAEMLPFEWFVPVVSPEKGRPVHPDPVLVLWLRENVFAADPLQKLSALLRELCPSPRPLPVSGHSVGSVSESARPAVPHFGPCRVDGSSVRFRWIGPAGSGVLRSVARALDERSGSGAVEADPLGADSPRVLVAGPTTPMHGLLPEGAAAEQKTLTDLGRPLGLEFRRTLVSDDYLMRAVLEELCQRGLRVPCKTLAPPFNDFRRRFGQRDHLVLISEWDTLYGRNMPRELVRRARDNLDAQGPAYERPSDWVHRFSYLRGLDGSLPGQGGGGTARDAAGNGGFIGDSREPGFGDDQLDYLTRVADAMEDLNRRLWTEDGRRERIGAIGILGNDFYDKLLILRALRARFPDAVFFTTDLDARFVDPAYSTWTRNLVVASAYGLSPMPGSPMASPVFRDSYQTSKFLATLAAVGGKEVLSFSSCADGDEALAPRLFEIGRTRVFPLALPDSRGVTSRICMTRSQALSAGVSPAARIRGDSPSRTMFVLFAAVLLMAFLSMPQFRRKILSMHGLAGIALLALSGALLFLCWGLPFDGQRLEPFSWTEGVSIWPTLLARIFVGFLIFELLRRTWKGIRESEERLGESDPDFEAIRRELTQRARERRGLWPRRSKRLTQSKDQEQAGLVRAWHWLATRPQAPRAGLRRWVLSLRDGSPRRREFSADYREYLECSRLGSRLGRVVLYIALFWFLSHLLIEEFGYEVQPYRGEWAMAMDLGTEILVGGILFLGLMFFVLDAVRLNVRLMRALRKRRPRKQGVAPVPQTDSVVGGAAASGVASPPPGAAQTGLELSDPRTREAEAVQEHESAFEDEWERISCVAQLTTPVHAFLTFPFIALFALVITKVDFLDNWHFPIANKALIGLALALIIASAISVRREAERMKRTVLARLDKVRDKLRRRSVETGVKERDLGRLERLEDRYADDVYERIRNLRAGAFHPWHQQASVQGMLWLLASLGVIGLERLLS